MRQNSPEIEEKSLKLDAKDRRILGELFNNARAPFSVVGRKVRLSKEAVNYRVKRLMESGFLVGFNTVIDVKRIGWEMFFVYIRFRNIDVAKEQEILGFLERHPNVAQLSKFVGSYDALIKVFVRHHADIDVIMKEVEERFKDSFDEYQIDYIVEETAVPFAFVYETGKPGKGAAATPTAKAGESQEKVELTLTELKMLKELAKNARMSLSDVAARLGESRDIVKYHLKKLEKAGVILKYRPDTLPKLLGYNWHFLILKTARIDERTNRILEGFLANHPNVTYFYRTVRSSDVQIELRAKTTEKLNEILMELRGILKDVLKNVEMLTVLHEHKYTYVPDCLLQR